jgi:hypothetical protein
VKTNRFLTGLAMTAGLLTLPIAVAAPAHAALPCEWSDTTAPSWNYPVDDVACVVLSTTSGIRLVGVTNVQPGWTYQVKSAGGTSDKDRVEIRFSNRATSQTVDFRYEPGRTKIG